MSENEPGGPRKVVVGFFATLLITALGAVAWRVISKRVFAGAAQGWLVAAALVLAALIATIWVCELQSRRWWKGVPLLVIGSSFLTVLVLTVLAFARGTPPQEPGRADSTAPCGKHLCTLLTVIDTFRGNHDDGVYIRACYDADPCERKALAKSGQTVYAMCRVQGLKIDGNTTWVKTPWTFVPNSVRPDGFAIASETGRSDPTSNEYGYITARHLAPKDAISRLIFCGAGRFGP